MKKHLVFCAFLCALSPASHATTENSLDEIIVTATRIEQPLRQSLSSTSVITRKEIQDSQAIDVPSLLKNIAGIEFYQSGGAGKQSSIFMRGTNSSHVLILLDGVRINSATTGATAVDQLMLDQVDRIEIVRGNVSSLYGSDAIGGVIQIFTRRSKGEPAFNVSAGIGSNNTQRASAGFGGQSGNTDFNLQVSRFRTDGISAINSAIVSSANPDQDGYENSSLSASLRHSLNTDNSLSATAFNSEGSNQYDSAFGLPADLHENTARLSKFSLVSDNRLSEIWQSKLQLAQGTDEYKSYTNGLSGSSIKTGNNQASWQNTLSLGTHGKLLLGIDKLEQKVTSQTAYTQTDRSVFSTLAGYTGNYDKHQVQLNIRQDKYTDFGEANTGLLAYGYILDEAWRVSGSVSSAFKAPTFNDLYGPAGWGSNPGLRPERADNREVGLHYSNEDRSLEVIYFDNHINDLIVTDGTFTLQNLNQAKINGAELSYTEQIHNTRIRAAVTRQNPSDADTGQTLLRRSRILANLAVSHQTGALRVGVEWQYNGERDDNHITAYPTQRVILPAYNLVGATAIYTLSQHLEFSLRADNLLNEDYILAHGYNTAGRSLFIGMRYQ